ncbi:MAG: TRAP transporter large permease subunit [Jhaorihella sp.]
MSSADTIKQETGADKSPSRVAYLIGKASRVLAMLAVAFMVVAICFEVFTRSVLGSATIWVTEVTTYLVVAITFIGAAFAESRGAHVRIALILDRLRPEYRRNLEAALKWVALAAVLITLWRFTDLLAQNYRGGTRSWSLLNTPVWLPQLSAVLGLSGLACVLARENRQASGMADVVGAVLFAAILIAVLADAAGLLPVRQAPHVGVALICGSVLLIALLDQGWSVAALALSILAVVALIFFAVSDTGLGLRSVVLIATLFLLLLSGLPVVYSLLSAGIAAMVLWFPPSSLNYIGERGWEAVNIFELAAIPMFVLMGSVLARSNASTEMFMATKVCMGRIRGGLAHASVVASGIFAAVSGSSIATAATMGRVAAPEMIAEGYRTELTFGTLAAGGTLGILIPPSIAMIIYGPLAGVPVTQLFIAGILPGLLMIAAFSAVIAIWLILDRNAAPVGVGYSTTEKLGALRGVLPFVLLMAIVLGSLYAGVATPTEAGAIGVLGAILVSVVKGTFRIGDLVAALEEAALATSFLLMIAVGAAVMSFAFDFMSMPQALIGFVDSLNLSNLGLFLAIVALYLLLGMFVEPISMILITLPIILPVVLAAGWDPLWFGIILVMLVEIGLITPPVGMILYVLAGVAGGKATLGQISYGTLPFVAAFLAMIFVFYAVPDVATFLPELLR